MTIHTAGENTANRTPKTTNAQPRPTASVKGSMMAVATALSKHRMMLLLAVAAPALPGLMSLMRTFRMLPKPRRPNPSSTKRTQGTAKGALYCSAQPHTTMTTVESASRGMLISRRARSIGKSVRSCWRVRSYGTPSRRQWRRKFQFCARPITNVTRIVPPVIGRYIRPTWVWVRP